jgi:hypothetical protein
MSRNKLDVPASLKTCLVATAAKVRGHDGKNAVVRYAGVRTILARGASAICAGPHARSLRHAVAAAVKKETVHRERVP